MVLSMGSRRTALEKGLIIGLVITALAAIGLLIGVIVLAVQSCDEAESPTTVTTTTGLPNTATTPTQVPTTPEPEIETCHTAGCITTSNMLLQNMKPSVNPCDDFYEYACGRFLEEKIIPDDKTGLTAFSEIEDEMRSHVRLLINTPAEENDIKPFKDLKLLNQACLDLDAIEAIGATEVLAKITDMGGWPVISSTWNEASWTWQGALAKIRQHGYSVNSIFSFSVSTDYRNNAIRRARIDQTGLGLSYEYITKRDEDNFYLAYKKYQVDLVKLFGPTVSPVIAEEKMAAALEFEYKLAMISLNRTERRDPNTLYNPMTITDLQTNYSQINWLEYLNSIMPDETKFVSTDIIVNAVPTFFEKLFPLLAETPKETIANYLMWRVAFSSASSLSKVFRDRHHEYNRITTGKEVVDPRGRQCSDITLSYFPHAVGSLYVRKYFKEEAKASVLEMIANIKIAFNEIVNELDWMDEATKTAALKKAENMGEQMAYADELLDDAKLTEYYAQFNVNIDTARFYDTLLRLGIASTKYNLNRLRQPVLRDDWTTHVTPAIVNAFYSPQENIIKFPAGILQGAFFNADRPEYMNYGGIGFVIGHEITHGFDDQGSNYDDVGNLKDWWAEETKLKFRERAQCIIDQYSGYTEPQTKLPLNGINTQGENIADNGGIKESYYAYQKWVKDHKEEPRLPGIDLTPNQLFWVSAAQVWCNVQRDESMRNRVQTGVHSPGQFRVLGPMKNRPEFAKDFNCGSTTTMNPPNKCQVW